MHSQSKNPIETLETVASVPNVQGHESHIEETCDNQLVQSCSSSPTVDLEAIKLNPKAFPAMDNNDNNVDMSLPIDCFDEPSPHTSLQPQKFGSRRWHKKANSLPNKLNHNSSVLCSSLNLTNDIMKMLNHKPEQDEEKETVLVTDSPESSKSVKSSVSSECNHASDTSVSNDVRMNLLLSDVIKMIRNPDVSQTEQHLASVLLQQSHCIDLLRAQRQGHDARIQQIERTLQRLIGTIDVMSNQLTCMTEQNHTLLTSIHNMAQSTSPSMTEQIAKSGKIAANALHQLVSLTNASTGCNSMAILTPLTNNSPVNGSSTNTTMPQTPTTPYIPTAECMSHSSSVQSLHSIACSRDDSSQLISPSVSPLQATLASQPHMPIHNTQVYFPDQLAATIPNQIPNQLQTNLQVPFMSNVFPFFHGPHQAQMTGQVGTQWQVANPMRPHPTRTTPARRK